MSALGKAWRKVALVARQAASGIQAAPRPLNRRDPPPPRPERVLMLAWFDPRGLGTIIENIAAIGQMSCFRYDLLNLWGTGLIGGLRLPRSVRLADYDGVFLHSTVSYDPDNLLSLDRRRAEKIADYPGLKIMMKQDENYRIGRVVEYLASRRFDLLLTCVPPASVRKVYARERLPDIRFLHTFTGYVSDAMRRLPYTQAADRPIDIGYRGSIQPYFFGRLAHDKFAIGETFQTVCAERGLTCDISSRRADRFSGTAWLDFLGRIKGVLGVESGASIFDLDGTVEPACQRYVREHPGCSFEEVSEHVLAAHEGNVDYGQVSPRHFEAAACRTVQILYEGRYSDVFVPGRHYLPLRRDLANLDDVLERLMDPAERLRMTEAAHEEIICNDTYHYGTFVKDLDAAVEALLDA